MREPPARRPFRRPAVPAPRRPVRQPPGRSRSRSSARSGRGGAPRGRRSRCSPRRVRAELAIPARRRRPAVRLPARFAHLSIATTAVVHPSGAPATAVRMADGTRTLAYSATPAGRTRSWRSRSGADLFITECTSFDRPLANHLDFTTIAANRARFEASRVMLTHMGAAVLDHLAEIEARVIWRPMMASSSISDDGDTIDALAERLRACRICRDAPRYGAGAAARAAPDLAGRRDGAAVHRQPGAGHARPCERQAVLPIPPACGCGLGSVSTRRRSTIARRVAIVPMGSCFPGLDAKGGDLPPRRECAEAWRAPLFAALPRLELILVIGGYAQAWHLRRRVPRRPDRHGASAGAKSSPSRAGRASCRCRIPPGATTAGSGRIRGSRPSFCRCCANAFRLWCRANRSAPMTFTTLR